MSLICLLYLKRTHLLDISWPCSMKNLISACLAVCHPVHVESTSVLTILTISPNRTLGSYRKGLYGAARFHWPWRASLHPGFRGDFGRDHSSHPQDSSSSSLQTIRITRLPRLCFGCQMPEGSGSTAGCTGFDSPNGQPTVSIRRWWEDERNAFREWPTI